MDILEKLFGSGAKVRIMRLFLFNPATPYSMSGVSKRTQVNSAKVRRYISLLTKIGMVRSKSFLKEKILRGKKGKTKKVRTRGFVLNTKFPYLSPLQSFLIDITPLTHDDILKKLQRVGRLKLVILSGVFIHDLESRVDILIVGDHIKRGVLENSIKGFEAEIGRELKYAAFETPDFTYRLSVYDKLIRDILDYKHKAILDRLDIEEQKSL
jgi:hypothetical protein